MHHPTRRSLLIGGGVALGLGLAGCSDSGVPGIRGLITPDDDDEQRLATAQSEQELIGLYTNVIAAVPSLAGELNPIRKHHLAHLGAMEVDSDVTSSSPSPGASTSATSSPSTALKQLRRAERSAAKARTNAAVEVQDEELARLLAQIGSSESAHAALLARTNR